MLNILLFPCAFQQVHLLQISAEQCVHSALTLQCMHVQSNFLRFSDFFDLSNTGVSNSINYGRIPFSCASIASTGL